MGRIASFGDGGRRVTVHAVLPRGELRPVLDRVGELLVFAARSAIYDQRGPDGSAWPPRRVPNVLGILRDLERGGSVHPSRLQPRKALYATGRLYDTLTYRVTGRTVRTASPWPQIARSMEQGGTETRAVTGTLRRRLGIYARSLGDAPEAARLWGVWRARTVTVSWPARRFSGLPRRLWPKVVGLLRSAATRRRVLVAPRARRWRIGVPRG